MTIDNILALATALMTVVNSIWLLALVIEIRRHNNAVSLHNARVSAPINATPPNTPPIARQSGYSLARPPINPSEVW